MKTTTTLALVGGLAYLGFRAKQAAEQAALAIAAPLPPPNSGPVVNGLSFYQLEGLGGFGSSLKKAVKKVKSSAPAKVFSKISPSALITNKVLKKTPLFKKASKNPSPAQAEAGQEVIYQDANGAPITLVQYNAIVSAMQSGNPVPTIGGWALPAGYIVATKPEATPIVYQSPGIIPPSINQGTAPVTYTPRPNEELIVNSSEDSDWGNLPGTMHTADSSGSPGLPGGVTTAVSTPAAQEAGPAAPESNTGKLLVGTGIAAVAAYLAFA